MHSHPIANSTTDKSEVSVILKEKLNVNKQENLICDVKRFSKRNIITFVKRKVNSTTNFDDLFVASFRKKIQKNKEKISENKQSKQITKGFHH